MLHKYLKDRVDGHHLSHKQLARKARVTEKQLYNILDGTTKNPRIETLIYIAFALDLHPLDVIRRITSKSFNAHVDRIATQIPLDATGFVDENPPDNELIRVEQTFKKTWVIQNLGKIPWVNRELICMDDVEPLYKKIGDEYVIQSSTGLIPHSLSIQIPDTAPNEKVELSIEFTAPRLPCSTISYWKMVDAQGRLCFPNHSGVWCLVKIIPM